MWLVYKQEVLNFLKELFKILRNAQASTWENELVIFFGNASTAATVNIDDRLHVYCESLTGYRPLILLTRTIASSIYDIVFRYSTKGFWLKRFLIKKVLNKDWIQPALKLSI